MKKGILNLFLLASFSVPLLASCQQGGHKGTSTPIENDPTSSTVGQTTNQETDTVIDAPFEVVDVKGRTLKFKKHAERAICLGAGSLRLYSYVGDMNKLIAVEDEDKPSQDKNLRPYVYAYKDILKDLPSCGKGGPGKPSYDTELLLTLRPDVIFTCDKADAAFLDNVQTQLNNTPVVGINYGDGSVFTTANQNEPFVKSVKSIAKIMGTEDKSNALLSYLNDTVKDLNDKTKNIADSDKPGVYFGGVGARKAKGLFCTTQDNAMLNTINVKNVMDETGITLNGDLKADQEVLARQNPDIVLLDVGGLSEVKKDLETVGVKETFAGWDALKNGKTYGLLPYRNYNIQCECGIVNAAYAASVVYPSLFTDFNVTTFGQEVFQAFYGSEISFDSYLTANNLKTISLKSLTF